MTGRRAEKAKKTVIQERGFNENRVRSTRRADQNHPIYGSGKVIRGIEISSGN
jgi:hypothetical protein